MKIENAEWTIGAYSRDPLRPLEDLLGFARQAGLAAVQLAWEQVARAATRDADAARLLERLRTASVELIGLDATALDCMDVETFERQTDDAYLQMQAAVRLGTTAVSLAAGPRGPVNFAHVVDGFKRLTVLAERLGVDISVRNRNHSSIEQLDDLHRLFHAVGAANLRLDLDLAEFQSAAVNPADAALSFPRRIARVRVCRPPLEATLAALRRDGFGGPILVAGEDGPEQVAQLTRASA